MRIARAGLVAALALALSACLNASTVIRVAPDGSGTIEQTLLFNPGNVENAFSQMGLKPSDGSKTSSKSKPVSESDLRDSVTRLGDGVTLVSMSPVTLPNGYQGVSARFAFDDISTLQTEDFLMPGPAKAEMNPSAGGDAIGFRLTRSDRGTSILTAAFNDKPGASSGKGGKSGKSGPPLDDPDMVPMLKAMFKGFRIGVELEVIGQIVETNADYVSGKRITLAEIDLEQLLREGKKLESLDKVFGPDASIAKVRPYLKDVKGLKINHPIVTVEFR
jgi:hypothetical protein